MKDLNFFSIYQGGKKEKKDGEMYFYIATAVVAGFILLTLSINIFRIIILKNSIKDYTEKYNASDVQSQLNEAEQINDKINVLSKYEGDLSDVVNSIKKTGIVSDDLLNDICGAMPSDISFKDFNIDGYDVKISGISHSRQAIGEYQHNLEQLSKIKSVHVNTIAKSNAVGEDYSFEITCVLKEVE